MPRLSTDLRLRLPQLRVLRVLAGGEVLLTRDRLKTRCGFAPISGTLTTALNGIREGSSSGKAHAGLLALGLVEEIKLDLDGMTERCLRITDSGRAALAADARSGDEPMRDRAASTNRRYAT